MSCSLMTIRFVKNFVATRRDLNPLLFGARRDLNPLFVPPLTAQL